MYITAYKTSIPLITTFTNYYLMCSSGAIGGGEIYGDGEHNSVIKFVYCDGNETELVDCTFNTSGVDECGPLQDAHVVCQGTAHIFLQLHILLI